MNVHCIINCIPDIHSLSLIVTYAVNQFHIIRQRLTPFQQIIVLSTVQIVYCCSPFEIPTVVLIDKCIWQSQLSHWITVIFTIIKDNILGRRYFYLFVCLSIARLSAFIIHLYVSSDNPLIRIFFIVLPGGGTVTYTYDNDYRVISETHEEKDGDISNRICYCITGT